MASKKSSRRCSATTKRGERCQAFALAESDFCAAHGGRAGGAPAGNQNRLLHGWYARPGKPILTIDDAVEDLGAQLGRSAELLADLDDPDLFIKVFGLHAQALSRYGKLLRDKRALIGDSADGILDAIGKVLDELSTELGVKL